MGTIRPEIVQRAFECCGIGEMGAKIPKEKLNMKLQTRLQNILPQAGDSSNIEIINNDGTENEIRTNEEQDDVAELMKLLHQVPVVARVMSR